jgi:hypothetical protein
MQMHFGNTVKNNLKYRKIGFSVFCLTHTAGQMSLLEVSNNLYYQVTLH